MVTAATIFMSLLGPEGLKRVAVRCQARAAALAEAAVMVSGVEIAFPEPRFHEVALRLPVPAGRVLEGMRECGVLGGVHLESWYPELGDTILACATETKTDRDIEAYALALQAAIESAG
jgi:glycine dehydrogenase subunit 1